MKTIAAILVGVLAAPSAWAADIAVKAVPVKAPPAATYSWRGCYVGGNAGWINGADVLNTYPSGTLSGRVDPLPISHSYKPGGSAATAGAQVGCNWQGGGQPLVFGIEADINWSGLAEGATATYPTIVQPGATWTPHTETVTKKLDWFSTYRLRAGYQLDRTLLYVTAGGAVGQARSSLNYNAFTIGTDFLLNGASTATRFGWTAGAGIEYALAGNWSLRAEYLYVDLGNFSFDAPLVVAPDGRAWGLTTKVRENIVRAGINYKFDWASPVVAKY
jgi:outer membrane immunogenic protein